MSNRTIIRTVITPRTITRRVGPAGAGGGATTFAALTDKATADLPVINGPLASALSGKQPLDADLTSWALITRAAGFDTFTGTPSSANLRALVTDETGSGALVFGTGPTLVGFTNTGAITFSTGTTFTYSLGIAAAHRTALGLGSLATQNGTFSGSFSGTHSGTSSGFNTGDQDLSGLVPKLSTLIVTGIADSGMGSALTLTMVEQSSLVNGRRSWLGSGATLFHDTGTGAWRLEYSDIDTFYFASIVDDSQEPWKLTGWTEEQGSGQPNFSLTPNALQPVQSSSGTLALTQSLNGEPDKLTNGYISGGTTVDDDATWYYGTNAAQSHRIALGGTADGSTGAALFGAATPAAARTTLGFDGLVPKIPFTVGLESDFTTTSTSFVNVTGVSFLVEANKRYAVSYYILTNKNDTSGLAIQFTGPTSPTKVSFRQFVATSSFSVNVLNHLTAFSTPSTTMNTFVGDAFASSASGIINNGSNAGTVQLQLRAVTGGTAKIYAGSYIQITEL